jgi:uncharacterized damage-inducible protein DinB
MTKQELIKNFYNNHKEIIDFVDTLTDEHFTYSYDGKWTAGQQISHVNLTLLPFLKVLPSKEFILQKFGIIKRPVWDVNRVIENYYKTSLQAPQQFIPQQVSPEQKATILLDIQKNILTIQQLLDQYTEEELNTLVLPHPLLGNLTLREMFYLMTYHPTHHLKQIINNLSQLKKISTSHP